MYGDRDTYHVVMELVWERERHRCYYCGTPVRRRRHWPRRTPRDAATLDHIIPRSRGGEITADNVVLACFRCNNDRGDQPFEVYIRRRNLKCLVLPNIPYPI